MSKDSKFRPQSKEVAKDTKMPAYGYQQSRPGTLVTTYEKKPGGQKATVSHGGLLQNLKAC